MSSSDVLPLLAFSTIKTNFVLKKVSLTATTKGFASGSSSASDSSSSDLDLATDLDSGTETSDAAFSE